jgi:hypothetical protein
MRLRLALILGLVACLSLAAYGLAPDRYAITEYEDVGGLGLRDTAGKQEVPAALKADEKTLVLVIGGQSNSTNISPTRYQPRHREQCQQVNVYDGKVYLAADPLVGTQGGGGSWASRLCDLVLDAGDADRVIMVPIALSGTSSEHWRTVLSHRLIVAVLRLKDLGYLKPQRNLHVLVLDGQGETDATNGTTGEQFRSNKLALIETAKRAGLDAPCGCFRSRR